MKIEIEVTRKGAEDADTLLSSILKYRANRIMHGSPVADVDEDVESRGYVVVRRFLEKLRSERVQEDRRAKAKETVEEVEPPTIREIRDDT